MLFQRKEETREELGSGTRRSTQGPILDVSDVR